jgi:hypothetical protein
LARSAPPLRGYGLDRLSPDRQAARKRSRFKVSGTAPFATAEPKQSSRMLWRRHGSFRQNRVGATLMACPTFAYRVVPRAEAGTLPDDIYIVPGPWPRVGRPAKYDVETWCVADDWPARVPVTDAEIDVFEAWFGDLFDELFGPRL